MIPFFIENQIANNKQRKLKLLKLWLNKDFHVIMLFMKKNIFKNPDMYEKNSRKQIMMRF